MSVSFSLKRRNNSTFPEGGFDDETVCDWQSSDPSAWYTVSTQYMLSGNLLNTGDSHINLNCLITY